MRIATLGAAASVWLGLHRSVAIRNMAVNQISGIRGIAQIRLEVTCRFGTKVPRDYW
jgi:hypothetical protein